MHTVSKLLAAAALCAPGLVQAERADRRFTQDGVTYVYTVTTADHGRQVITGHRSSDGSAFHLVVDGDRVDGVSGGRPVAFRMPRAPAVVVAAD